MRRTAADEPATLEERYAAARNTSDLTLDLEHRRPVDLLIAHAQAHSDLSAALADLRSQWDRAPRVRRPTEAALQALAASYPKRGKPDTARARVDGLMWYTRQIREQIARLHAMPRVLELVTAWCTAHGIDPALARGAIYHYVDDLCHACDGRGAEKAHDAPSLTGRMCQHCQGTGRWPESRESLRVKNYLREATSAAKARAQRKLR